MRNIWLRPLKFLPVGLLACVLLLAGTCKKKSGKKTVAITESIMGKTWLHSHEEDRGDTIVFRPNTYDFPPARGRTGFTMEPDGVFRQYDIAPTDGLEENDGKWEVLTESKLHITFPQKQTTDFEAEIISVSPEMLKVIKTYKQQ